MSEYPGTFTTVEAVERQLLKANSDTVTLTDYSTFVTLARDYVREACAYIQTETGRNFVPHTDTRDFYTEDVLRNPYGYHRKLFFDRELLSVDNVSAFGTSLTSDQYRVMPANRPVKTWLEFAPNVTLSAANVFTNTISVSGTWGYLDTSTPVHSTLTTLGAAVTDTSATTITVASSSAVERLSYLRIGDEYLRVLDVDSATDTVIVERGAAGTTATTHSDAATVSVYVPPYDARNVATRLAAFLLERRSDDGTRAQVAGGSIIWGELPQIIRIGLRNLMRPSVSVI